MKTILFIDTADSKKVTVAVERNGKRFDRVSARETKAQMVLPMVEELLKSQKLKLSDITEIKVNTGPGSFTGLRVGLAVAHTLGKLLHVPVNGKRTGEVKAMYSESKWE